MDGWGAFGWGDDEKDDDIGGMRAVWRRPSDDDMDLLKSRAQESCDDAGIESTLRAVHKFTCAALVIQITWRGYRAAKKARRNRILKQKEEEFLRRQRGRNRDAGLMDWLDTLDVTVYSAGKPGSSANQQQAENTDKSWKAPGVVARAFSVYKRMDWTARTEGIRMAGRYMQLRGWWAGGKDGYLTDEEVERLLKLESSWKAAGGAVQSQRYAYMLDGTVDCDEGPKNGGRWHGATTASRGFEYFPGGSPSPSSSPEKHRPSGMSSLQNKSAEEFGTAGRPYLAAESLQKRGGPTSTNQQSVSGQCMMASGNDTTRKSDAALASPRPKLIIGSSSGGSLQPSLPEGSSRAAFSRVHGRKDNVQDLEPPESLAPALDLEEPSLPSSRFSDSPDATWCSQSSSSDLHFPAVHGAEMRVSITGSLRSEPVASSDKEARALAARPKHKSAGTNRDRSPVPQRRGRSKAASPRRQRAAKSAGNGRLVQTDRAKLRHDSIEKREFEMMPGADSPPDEPERQAEGARKAKTKSSRARSPVRSPRRGSLMRSTFSSMQRAPPASSSSFSYFAGQTPKQVSPGYQQGPSGICSFADPLQPPRQGGTAKIFRHPIFSKKQMGLDSKLPPVRQKSMPQIGVQRQDLAPELEDF